MFHHRAFFKAAINLMLVCVLVISGLTGCRKDGANESLSPLNLTAHSRSGDLPAVTHGMLHFNSFPQLMAFTQSLEAQEADTTLVKNAYAALGIDVTAETIPNLTDHPICLTTEIAIGGYTSARKAEENAINTALDQGDSTIHSIVLFPYWKTALNAEGAVHVGRRIYKYYDNGGIAIVLNDDWTLYEAIKTQLFEDLQQSYNLIITSDAREGWEQFFTINPDESIGADKLIFQPLFRATEATEGNLAITNFSWVESTAGLATFTWIYSDNTTSTGPNPNRVISPTDAITVIVDNGAGTRDTLSGVESILACSTDNFTITYLSNNQIRFELPGFNPSNPANLYTIRWEFSNGSYSTTNPVVKTFGANGTATCKLLHKNSGEVACLFTKPFFIKCGDKKEVNGTYIFTQCGQRWKLDGSIWVKTGEVGCKVKYLKRVGVLWLPANNQAACTNLSGTYIREVYNPNKSCLTITASGTKCLGNGTFPTSVSYTIPEVPSVFADPGNLSASLGIQVCGVFRGWGYAGFPRLVLP